MSMIGEPTSEQEYEQRYERNLRTSGGGASAVTHYPCPFCAAPDWLESDNLAGGTGPVLCLGCGRAARVLRTERGRSEVPEVELVQVSGPAPPEWMSNPPRFMPEAIDSIDPAAHQASGRGHMSALPPTPTLDGPRPARKRFM